MEIWQDLKYASEAIFRCMFKEYFSTWYSAMNFTKNNLLKVFEKNLCKNCSKANAKQQVTFLIYFTLSDRM